MHSLSFFRKVVLLAWKNHISQLNNIFELVWLLVSPALICLILVYIRIRSPTPNVLDMEYDEIDLQENWEQLNRILLERRQLALAENPSFTHSVFIPQSNIAYSPNNYQRLVDLITAALVNLQPMVGVGFENCFELQRVMQEEHYFAGICIDDIDYAKTSEDADRLNQASLTSNNLPVHLNYTIVFPSELRIFETVIGANWMTKNSNENREKIVKRLKKPVHGGHVGYVQEGFINIQKALSEAYLHALPNYNSSSITSTIKLRRFPIKEIVDDPMTIFMITAAPFVIVFAYLFNVQIIVMQVVQEKHSDYRSFMYHMNVGNVANLIGRFLNAILYMLASAVIVSVLLKLHWKDGYAVYTSVPWYMVLIVLLSYSIAATNFCLMITTFFTNSDYCVRITTIIWLLSYMTYFIWYNDPERTGYMIYMVCSLPNSLLGMTLQAVYEHEIIQNSEWVNIAYTINRDINSFSINKCISLFYLQSLCYALIGIYMEIWNTIDFRAARRLFSVTREKMGSYDGSMRMDQLSSRHQHNKEDIPMHQQQQQQQQQQQLLAQQHITFNLQQRSHMALTTSQAALNPTTSNLQQQQWISSTKIFEVEPTYKKYKIKIRQLTKVYESKVVLNDFTMVMYENEVTVLMGHNGAGKTTLLRILSGLSTPTSGTAIIEGYNIRIKRSQASRIMGVAIADHLLLPNLSVINQLRFVCMVKGLKWDRANEQSQYYMKALNLTSRKTVPTQKLSISDRNVLMIACAFAGNSSVILIDDLHADLDTETQKLIWEFIQKEKEQRAVLITTTSTEPTEVLSDRVAIIANGELKCTGTKPFLRNMYGHGYRLTCIKGYHGITAELVAFFARYMPTISIASEVGQRVTFVLETKYEDIFTDMLDELETNMYKLNVVSCTLRETSMEEIYLHMGHDSTMTPFSTESTQSVAMRTIQSEMIGVYMNTIDYMPDASKRRKDHLAVQQVRAYLYKHCIFGRAMLPMQLFNYGLIIFIAIIIFLIYSFMNRQFRILDVLPFNNTQVDFLDAVVEVRGNEKNITNQIYSQYIAILYWYDSTIHEIFTELTETENLLKTSDLAKTLHYKYFFGATFEPDSVTAWFNNVPLHSAPFSLNTVHNALARIYQDDESTIDVALKPLAYQISNNAMYTMSAIRIGTLLAINISICFAFIWPGSVSQIIEEHITGFKDIQFLSGANLLLFWFASLLYDFCKLLIISLWLIVVTMFFMQPSIDYEMIVWLFIVLLLSGVNVISMTFLMSRFFRNALYAYMAIVCITALGTIIFLAELTMSLDNEHDLPEIFLFLSQYAFCLATFKLFLITDMRARCNDDQVRFISLYIDECQAQPQCCKSYAFYKGQYNILNELIALCLTIIVVWFLLLIFEYRKVLHVAWLNRNPRSRDKAAELVEHKLRHKSDPGHKYEIDPAVIEERAEIAQLMKRQSSETVAFICQDVGKVYGKHRVINRLDLIARRGECIGILGFSGAGKTTLVRMLIGQIRPTYGRISILGHMLSDGRKQCMEKIGYSPQETHLPGPFTPCEILEIFAQIRGMDHKTTKQVCESLANMLGFYAAYNIPLQYCSSGTARRVSVAIAVLGTPKLVCLDGTPNGIDPAGKRQIFNVVTRMRKRGCTFVFTSLTPTECESLCNRIAILLNGHIWSMGAMVHMHERYASGYMLSVRMKRLVRSSSYIRTWSRIYKERTPIVPQLKFIAFMEKKFPQSVIKERHNDILIFYLPLESTQLSTLFYVIRRNAFGFNIEDFKITRNTLSGIYKDMLQMERLHNLSDRILEEEDSMDDLTEHQFDEQSNKTEV